MPLIRYSKPFALVTGGSAGIGLELAKLLAADGYNLVIGGSSDRVFKEAEELQQSGVEVIPVKSDLATPEGVDALWKAATDSGRRVEVAIFNAGIALGGAFMDIPLEEHLRLININVMSSVRLAYAVMPYMVKHGGGKILLVSSLSATTPTPYETVYGPSKAFLTSFGHGIREELRGTGVQVTILHPGATATEFHARAGMNATAFGDNSWKNDPAALAKQGYDGMQRGETSLIGGTRPPRKQGGSTASLPRRKKSAAMLRWPGPDQPDRREPPDTQSL